MSKNNYEWMNRNAVTVDGKSPFYAKDAASKFSYSEGGGIQSAQAMQRPNIPGYNPNKPIIFEPPSFQGTGQFPPQMGGFTPMDMQQLHQQCQAFPAPYSPQGAPAGGASSQGMPPAYIMPPQNYMPPQASGMQGQFMPQPQMPFSMPPGGGFNWM